MHPSAHVLPAGVRICSTCQVLIFKLHHMASPSAKSPASSAGPNASIDGGSTTIPEVADSPDVLATSETANALVQQDVLSMFFQDNFSPENYVNALHASLIGLEKDPYSSSKLAHISNKSQDLITHLEYNTNEILRELADKTQQLRKASSTMGHTDATPDANDHSRLQYYVDALRNSVDTLQGDVALVRSALPTQDNRHVHSLIALKTVKANILSVCDCLQKACQMVGGDSISDRQFAEALQSLHESLKVRARELEEARADVMSQISEFKAWVPMFQPFSRFGPAYSKFIMRLDDI